MSFDIALSGIQAINEQLDTVSHNIANAGTFGFKSGRANFSSMVAGSQPTGTEIGSVTQSIGLSGGVLNTGRSLDASINGRGFFITRTTAGETQYTRVGIFDADKSGFLVDASGRRVQGFGLKPPSTILGAQGDLAIPTGQIPAVASSKMNYVGNMSADWTVPAGGAFGPIPAGPVTPTAPPDPTTFNMSKTSIVYDSLGSQHTLTQYFVKDAAAGKVNVHFVVDGTELAAGSPQQLAFEPNGQLGPAAAPVTSFTLTMPTPIVATGATMNTLAIDYSGTTMFAGEATTSTNAVDGYASGVFAGVDLANDGSVIAKYTNGQKQSVGKIAIATFPDEGQLTSVSDTSWVESNDSGTPLVTTPGSGMAGSLNTAALEQSNVDITSELVGLMTSQRNYQANSKVIQTESTMMQSLMQAL
jgi:flagellar hook protein FlgE